MLGDFVFSFLVDDISDKLWHQDRERVLLERSVLLQHQQLNVFLPVVPLRSSMKTTGEGALHQADQVVIEGDVVIDRIVVGSVIITEANHEANGQSEAIEDHCERPVVDQGLQHKELHHQHIVHIRIIVLKEVDIVEDLVDKPGADEKLADTKMVFLEGFGVDHKGNHDLKTVVRETQVQDP